MKREFDEISDDDWEKHDFKSSRVLKRSSNPSPPPPPIESFAFNSQKKPYNDHSDDSDCVEITSHSFQTNENHFNLEDEIEDHVEVRPNRGRRFVVDDDDDDDDVNDNGGGDDDDDESEPDFAEVYEVESSEEEDDVVVKALQKCAKISAELRKELYGSSSSSVTSCDRYAEVESSSVRIVTQVTIAL